MSISRRVLSVLVAVCIILTLAPVSSAVGEDSLQKVFRSIMNADDAQKNQFSGILQKIYDGSIRVVSDSLVDEAYAINCLKVMEKSGVKEALQTFANISDTKKPAVISMVTAQLTAIEPSGFPTIRTAVNMMLANDMNDDDGLYVMINAIKMAQIGVDSPICRNDAINPYKIDLVYDAQNSTMNELATDVINQANFLLNLITGEDVPSPSNDPNAFGTLLNYLEEFINKNTNDEIYNFKKYIVSNGIDFQSTPYASPTPTSGNSSGGGGVPAASSTPTVAATPTAVAATPTTVAATPTAVAATPTVNASTSVTPTATKIAEPTVEARPTPPPADKVINSQLVELDTTIKQDSIGVQQADKIVSALNTIQTNISNKDANTTTGNLAAAAAAINNVVDITQKVADAASKTEIIKAATNTYAEIAEAAKSVTGESNAVTAVNSLSSLINNAGSLLSAADSKQKAEVAQKVSDVLSSISVVAGKAKTETSTLQIIDSVIKSVDNIDSVAKAAGSTELKTDIQNKTADVLSSTANMLKNVKSEDNAITAAMQVAALVDRTADVLASAETKNVAQKLAKSVKEVVAGTVDLVSNITTPEKAIDMVSSIAKAVVKVTEGADMAGSESRKVTDQLVKVAEKVVEKVSKEQVVANVKGNKAIAQVTEEKAKAIIEKAQKAAEVAEDLKKEMKDSGINKTVEKKVTIDVPVKEGINNVQAELPALLLTSVKSKGIEKVEIATGVAKLAVEPNFMKETSAKSVALEASKTLEGNNTVINLTATMTDTNGKQKQLSQFQNKIRVEVPYTLKAGENADKITVMYIGVNGKETNMSGKFDSELKTVTFLTDHFSKYVIKSNVVKFKDVPADHWAKDNIEGLAAKGIVEGRNSQDVFMPNANITRAEFAKYMSIALNMVDPTAVANFKDVPKNSSYYTYIASAVKSGIIMGRPDGTFAPNETISRQDITVIMARALKETEVSNAGKLVGFNDKSSIADYAVKPIALCVKYGLISGKPGNIVDPNGKMTRAEAAAVIYRLYNNN
ncbi:S-layer homology domain-containing protein [Pseudobacteroides cellulosolvens]|uniref:S-layer domain-containing protein n=1 Tax=Pseudobacteroides cellulosolvens ATCC 35603 = DSM 2933 TaxID=398512 RepID=A0A0L6JN89_9FIRM|nr:S-layer homology domain-containing protein [Pseudobacteroides cellulosolvens]KNY26837.1 S-layer domain-containing protein [Pseudobacteroides cellulosolvens ATCC 35603 = DSM 2933]